MGAVSRAIAEGQYPRALAAGPSPPASGIPAVTSATPGGYGDGDYGGNLGDGDSGNSGD